MRFLFWLALAGLAVAQPIEHPLDPLTADEINQATRLLQESGKLNASCRFPAVMLHEPSKQAVLGWHPGDPLARQAEALVLDVEHAKLFQAVVDLQGGRVVSYTMQPGAHPGVLNEEFEEPRAYVRADPRWQEALRKRGVSDFDNVQIDVWAVGLLTEADRKAGRRLLRCLSFYRGPNHKNPYYRPIEGVVALVDPKLKQVVRVEDTGVIAPINKGTDGELDAASIGKQLGSLRAPLKPTVSSQPEGVNYKFQGHSVEWDRWRFRYSMHPREGLVLNQLEYHDKDRWRPVLYRGSLSEMVVPYGDNAANWSWRNAFDLGEYGVGRLANPLRRGYEVPATATLLDSVFSDDKGQAYVTKGNVAIYERDGGILWKHQDFESEEDQTRPARNLYLTYVATVGNYDYALSWVLGQDGSVGVDTQLTGIVLAKGVKSVRSQGMDATGDERFGRLVGRNIVAPNHQHFFNFRLDMDVDGPGNALRELNNEAVPPGPDNPMGNAFMRRITPLKDELAARRDMNMHAHRSWLVINPKQNNELGQPTAYQLMPEENSVPYLHPDAPIYKRAGFLKHHLWGTRWKGSELNASGAYPNQSTTSSGLPGWSQKGESLEGEDVVLWYTFGVTHNPRPEEWPIMPSHRTGFKLIPNGFFSQNPAYDVPPPAAAPAAATATNAVEQAEENHQP